MKKFLVFLMSIVIIVSFGLVTYYFLRNDEIINFKNYEIYCNVGDTISIADLGKNVKKASYKTKYNYNAGDETVVSSVTFDDKKGYYVAKKGGDFEVVISTTNKNFAKFKFVFHIGDGSDENPYFVRNEQDLVKIGRAYSLSSKYELLNDVMLSTSFQPIGFDAIQNEWTGFNGFFEGNNHTIVGSNFAYETENAGLFASLNGATVRNLTLKNFDISGSYSNAGVLAGSANNAVVNNVRVKNSKINNAKIEGVTAGLIGSVSNGSNVSTCAVEEISLTAGSEETPVVATVAGLIGSLNQSTVSACFSTGKIVVADTSSKVAGFIGNMVVSSTVGSVQQSYANVESENANYAGFISNISTAGNMDNANYLKFLVGNYSVASNGVAVKEKPDLIKKLYSEENLVYGVKNFASTDEMKSNCKFVFYATNSQKVYWDKVVWKIVEANLPVLYSTNVAPSAVSSEYYLADNDSKHGYDTASFLAFIAECRANGGIKNQNYTLHSDIDLTDVDWTSLDIENSIFDGNGFKIINLNLKNTNGNNLALFNKVTNSTIKNVTFENVKFTTNANQASVVATSVEGTSSTLTDITVNFANEITNIFTSFAGIVNSLAGKIENCKVQNLTINENAKIDEVAGVANTINAGARLENNEVTANLKAEKSIAGVANTNSGSILNTNAKITVDYYSNVNTNSALTVAGLVDTNNAESSVQNAIVDVNFKINKTTNEIWTVGAVYMNNGSISVVTVKGEGIELPSTSASSAIVAGLVGLNNGSLTSSKCTATKIGTFTAGKNHMVAGIAFSNSSEKSKIEQCVVTSNVEGNIVAGAVVKMQNAQAKMDQVLIGAYDFESKTLTQNKIAGDRYVAGVVVDLRNGNVSNVQASSLIEGKANSTVSSLIVLLFPNGATFKTATIDSTFTGFGSFYSETWFNFRNATASQKQELGYETTGNDDMSFNLLSQDNFAGSMQSVIINSTSASREDKTYTTSTFQYGMFFPVWWPTYENSENSSYFKLVNSEEFKLASTFKGNIVMTAKTGVFNLSTATFTKKCTFNFETVWAEADTGIALSFVDNI